MQPTIVPRGAVATGPARAGQGLVMAIRSFVPAVAITVAILAATVPARADGERPERWYDLSRVESGREVYARNCAVCHGARGEAVSDWRSRDADGAFPPPPLNGSAHTWHHPFGVLARQIKFGAPEGAGTMPAFQGELTDEEIVDVIAWFQSLWPDEIYARWWEIQQQASRQ